jgi:hypothetical protein
MTGLIIHDLSLCVCTCVGFGWFGKVKQGSLVKELFESRERAEEEESNVNDRGSLRNRLHVSSLVRLLEERRDLDLADGGGGPAAAGSQSVSVNVRKASSLLAEKYGMDVEKVERLVRFVNVPSVREGEKGVRRRYVRDAESGEEVAITEVSLYFSPFFFQNVFFWEGNKVAVLLFPIHQKIRADAVCVHFACFRSSGGNQ